MQLQFSFDYISKVYNIPALTLKRRAKKMGITSKTVTEDQAFEIANYGFKPKFDFIIVYKTIEILPSKLNYTTLEDL